MAENPVILLQGVSKRLGRRDILRNLDLTVSHGEILALAGSNGTGKTTLIRILSTLMRVDSGAVTVNGYHLPLQAAAVRRGLGVVFDHPAVYGDLTARENLQFHARLNCARWNEDLIEQWLTDVGLDPQFNDPVRTYSRGMQQRLALAKALLTRPNILLLDEPFTGLDQDGCGLLNSRLMSEAARGCTILFTGHDPDGMMKTANRVLWMERGCLVSEPGDAELPSGGGEE